eukprot:scaffold207_cov267-Pinguiococcus_pyrenoidosus.AAC.17
MDHGGLIQQHASRGHTEKATHLPRLGAPRDQILHSSSVPDESPPLGQQDCQEREEDSSDTKDP